MNTTEWILLISFAVFLYGVLAYFIGYSSAKHAYLQRSRYAYSDGYSDGQADLLKDAEQIKQAYQYFYGRRP